MIRINEDHNGVTVYRYDKLPGGSRDCWTYDGKRKIVKEGDNMPWWLVMDHDTAQALVSALADYGAIQSPEYAYIEGELKATKLHLADMRRLAILDPPTGAPE